MPAMTRLTSLAIGLLALLAAPVWAAAGDQAAPAAPKVSAPAIPPDGDHATKALVDSPRHGEWVDIALDPKDPKAPKLKTWVAYPERKDKAPVVLVVHEIFGMTDWVRAVADQLAAEGYIAVAPDLLSGKGPNGGNSDSFTGDSVRDAIRKLEPAEVNARLDAARAYAIALPAATDRVACMGFCWGGTTAFAYATAQPKLQAAVVWYGTGPTDRDTFAKLACPVLGQYGGDDARVTSTVEPTEKLAKELSKSFTPKVYAGAGHGFLRQQTGRDNANLKAATEAWATTIAFLRDHLASPK